MNSARRSKQNDNLETLDMSPETARKLFDNGGVLVVVNLPVGSVFGIDMKIFSTGEKFRGVKMIPPGLHFVHYSSVSSDGIAAPRTGFFHYFRKKEVLLKKWDKQKEEFFVDPPSQDEIERIQSNLQNLDPYLASYPYQGLKEWSRLTCNISESLLQKLQPLSEIISSVTQLEPQTYPPLPENKDDSPGGSCSTRSHMTLEDKMLPDMKQVPGTEIRFTKIPDSKYPTGSTASEITKHCMDSTYVLEQLLQTYDSEEDILGELQMALVCFLIGHVYESFEHWKKLLQVFCSVDSGLDRHAKLLRTFLTILHYQIKEIPTDFFVDITSDNNCLVHNLRVLFENAQHSSDESFRTFVANFKKNVTKTYKWDFEHVPDDELPVIVEV